MIHSLYHEDTLKYFKHQILFHNMKDLSKGKIDFPCAKLELILPCFDKPKTCYSVPIHSNPNALCAPLRAKENCRLVVV